MAEITLFSRISAVSCGLAFELAEELCWQHIGFGQAAHRILPFVCCWGASASASPAALASGRAGGPRNGLPGRSASGTAAKIAGGGQTNSRQQAGWVKTGLSAVSSASFLMGDRSFFGEGSLGSAGDSGVVGMDVPPLTASARTEGDIGSIGSASVKMRVL